MKISSKEISAERSSWREIIERGRKVLADGDEDADVSRETQAVGGHRQLSSGALSSILWRVEAKLSI